MLYRLERIDEALESFEKAIALNPRFAEAHRDKGILLAQREQLEDALAAFEKSLQIDARDFRSWFERSCTFARMNRIAEAVSDLDRAIALNPTHAEAQVNRAHCKLLLGKFDDGLRMFEWRWKRLGIDPSVKYGLPLWLGTGSLEGKRLMIPREQGFGDVIQFCRYVPAVEARGAAVVMVVSQPLAGLMRTLTPRISVVVQGEPTPVCDVACPIASLPLAFRTTLETIPTGIPYLSADEATRQAWAERLGPRTRLRAGIAWSGNPEHLNDINRSVPLDSLRSLLELPFDFHVVQKQIRQQDVATVSAFSNLHVHPIEDFDDVAAVMMEMDLVISVDTAAAHLAGALGRPVWILLPFIPDWRWMLDRNDSPWYPTARLFRQPRPGDWASVARNVREQLLRR